MGLLEGEYTRGRAGWGAFGRTSRRLAPLSFAIRGHVQARAQGRPGVLARYAQAYARELGVAEGRVRAWLAYMIMAGVLDRATTADSARFIVKGGVALELRLRDRARATKEATSSSGTRLRTSPAASRRR
jgi:hypothetical protein